MRPTLPGALLASLLLACAPGPGSTQVALEPCRAPGLPDRGARCGTVEVPEDRADPAGRRIALSVIVLPATGADPAPDPLFALAGGPGHAARYLAPLFAGHPARERRDVVLVDQRGTGASAPLGCLPEEPAELVRVVLAFAVTPEACGALDADPALYLTPMAMDDLDQVRAALGYDRINLWGGSYGSRAALAYLRRHGESVRSVVLDGVAPMTLAVPRHFARGSQDALDRLLEDCAADRICGAEGDAGAALDRLLRRLEADPVEVTVTLPGGQRLTFPFGRAEAAGSVLYGLYDPTTAAVLPTAIRQAEAGEPTPLATIGATFASVAGSQLSFGMMLSVLCAEDVPFFTQAEMARDARGTFLGPEYGAGLHEACRGWPRGGLPDGWREPVASDVPTLLLSGEADPVTPPRWAEEAAAHLPNSLHLVFPDQGHGQSHPCGQRLVAAFLEAGSVEGLDTACAAGVARPAFPGG